MGGVGRVYQRGKRGLWWVEYYRHGHKIRESSGSINEAIARRLLRKRIAQLEAGKLVGPSEDRVMFEDLWSGLRRDYSINERRSVRMLGIRLLHLKPFFGDRRAVDITPPLVSRYIEQRRVEKAANASINRELAMLRRAFKLALDGGVISSAPKITLLSEDNARQGFVEHGDFGRLVSHLPEYLRDPVRFLYLSGWRVGEMRSLKWPDIEMGAGVAILRRENSKNARSRTLPLAGELWEIMERASAARTPQSPFVFRRGVLPIGDFKRAWGNACAAAGLGGLLVHDLRRTAARNMVRAGVPERVVMEITGHRTREIFDRYNIVNEADLRTAQERLGAYLGNQPKGGKIRKLRGGR